MAITPSNPSGGPVLDASPFVSAGNAQLASNAAISTSILQNNPYLMKLKGYMDAQRLLNETKDIGIKEQQVQAQVKQWSTQNALETDKFKQQQVVDKQTNLFHQGMLDLQKSQLAAEVDQHAIENQRADKQIDIHQQEFGQTLGLQKDQLSQQKELGMAGLDIQKQGLGIQEKQLDQTTAYQNAQIGIATKQNDISQQNADTTKAQLGLDLWKTQKTYENMSSEDQTPEAYQDRLKNENEIIKKAKEDAGTASNIIQKVENLKDAVKDAPYVGGGGKIVEGTAYALSSVGVGGALGKWADNADAAYGQLRQARSSILTAIKTAQIGNGRWNTTVLDLLNEQVGSSGNQRDDTFKQIAIMNDAANTTNLTPTFLTTWKAKYGSLNGSDEALSALALYSTRQAQAYTGKDPGTMPKLTKGDMIMFMNNYPKLQAYADKNNMSLDQVLDAVKWRGN